MTRRLKQSPGYSRIKELVVQVLASYKHLNGLIKAAERHSHGIGLVIPADYNCTTDTVIFDGKLVPIASAQLQAMKKLELLQNQKQVIEESMALLKEIDAKYEAILRARYIEGKTVIQVCQQFCISESTYDYWLIEAINRFAMYAGISSGGRWFQVDVESVG